VKQAEFIGELAETRSVTEAARRVGVTRETAYRLRRRKWSASFCAAWDAAMGRPVMLFRPKFEGAGLMVARLEKLGLHGRALGMARLAQVPADETAPLSKVTNAELAWLRNGDMERYPAARKICRGDPESRRFRASPAGRAHRRS
jgi:hypothetical protein